MSIQNGHGMERYPSGCVKYVGEFQNGMYHGSGRFYWETPSGMTLQRMNGTIAKPHDHHGFLMYEGKFQNGDFSGEGISYFSDGRLCHKGMFKNGKPDLEVSMDRIGNAEIRKELEVHIRNQVDQLIYDQMIEETTTVVHQRIGNMICTCMAHFMLDQHQKTTIRNTLTSLNADSFGCVAVNLDLLPYFEFKFQDQNDVGEISNGYVIHLMNYLTKKIRKEEFVKRIWLLQEAVGLSNPFYNALIDYYGARRKSIIAPVLNRI